MAVVQRLAVRELGVAPIGLPLGGGAHHDGHRLAGGIHEAAPACMVSTVRDATRSVKHREEQRSSQPRPTVTFGAGSTGALSRVKLRARQDQIGYARQAALPSRTICRVMLTEP